MKKFQPDLVIEADKAIVGHLAAFTAKKLLEGHTVAIVNAEKAVFSGDARKIVARYHDKRGIQRKEDPDKSPKFPRRPDLFLKRVVFGMLPTSRRTTRKACLHRLRVFMGVPKELEGKAKSVTKTRDRLQFKPVTVKQVCEALGWEKVD